jgi:formamidopyrimidine-DNA glycosylase
MPRRQPTEEPMPELPEVETVVRDLRPLLTGRRIISVRHSGYNFRKPWKPAWKQQLQRKKLVSVERRGKWIVLHLEGSQSLVLHLGMSGQLRVVDAEQPLQDHVHLVLGLDDGRRQLRFRDIRRFGSATLFADDREREHFFAQSKLGPEPFALDAKYWKQRVQQADRPLKAMLLDQRVVAGVGNIYADESLFQAKLHPARLGRDLADSEISRLRRAIITVLNRAIEKRGSTIRNYLGGSGLRGGYQDEFRVYGRTGKPCPRCGVPIERVRLAGRSTHFCPKCQPTGRPLGPRPRAS